MLLNGKKAAYPIGKQKISVKKKIIGTGIGVTSIRKITKAQIVKIRQMAKIKERFFPRDVNCKIGLSILRDFIFLSVVNFHLNLVL